MKRAAQTHQTREGLVLDRPADLSQSADMKLLPVLAGIMTLVLPIASADNHKQSKAEVLFDGKTLKGWNVNKGEEKWWKVADGAIEGGSLTEHVPHNTF